MNIRRKFHAAAASMHLRKHPIRRSPIFRLQHLNIRMELLWNWKSEAFLLQVNRTVTCGLGQRVMQSFKVELSRYFRVAEDQQQQEDKRVRPHLLPEHRRTELLN